MHRFSTSWSNRLPKLGFNLDRKRRTPVSRRCGVEALEPRQMLTYLVYLGEAPSNCPDDCPCACSQVGVTKGNAATTDAGNLQYSSQTQSHPVLMFGLDAYSFNITTKVKVQLTVNNTSYVAYFGAPSQEVIDTGMAIFGMQIDASSMPSGVYD